MQNFDRKFNLLNYHIWFVLFLFCFIFFLFFTFIGENVGAPMAASSRGSYGHDRGRNL